MTTLFDTIYTQPFAGGDISIIRCDARHQWGGLGDVSHHIIYDVAINGQVISGGYDNLPSARAFLNGYVLGMYAGLCV